VNLLHFGMVIVGLDYGHAGQSTLEEITGGSPYGATTIAGSDGSRRPTENELQGARYQGIAALQERDRRPPPLPSRVDEISKRVLDLDDLLKPTSTRAARPCDSSARAALSSCVQEQTVSTPPTLRRRRVLLLTERKTPSGSGPNGGVYRNMVAGAGFEPTTFGL
jgi:hypothetical protein